jgi:hypothetical protein
VDEVRTKPAGCYDKIPVFLLGSWLDFCCFLEKTRTTFIYFFNKKQVVGLHETGSPYDSRPI